LSRAFVKIFFVLIIFENVVEIHPALDKKWKKFIHPSSELRREK